MKQKNLIVQAGGKGTRLKHLSENVPKCLVPVSGKTLFSRVVEHFGSDHNIFFIVDHLSEVVISYRDTWFKEVTIIETSESGTCSGIKDALSLIPEDQNVKISWSDLLFEKKLMLDETKNTIGLSQTFDCRYQHIDGKIIKKTGNEAGIAGFFSFICKSVIKDVPASGSFVGNWLRLVKKIKFSEFKLHDVYEIGTLDLVSQYESKTKKSRFFNQVVIEESRVTKTSRDRQYDSMIGNEFMWYNFSKFNSLSFIPKNVKILEEKTLIMPNLGQSANLQFLKYNKNQKQNFIKKVINHIHQIHNLDRSNLINYANFKLYVQKVLDRTLPYKKMIRCFNKKLVKINGKEMINPFENFENLIKDLNLIRNCDWAIVHGDVTLSNILIDGDENLFFIDPRASLGLGFDMFGDPIYDFAKLYYSIIDGYDSINTRQFRISYHGDEIKLTDFYDPQSENIFFHECKCSKKEILSRLYGIWFSLVGWVSEDIDAMNYAFCKGIIAYNRFKECE